MSVYSSFIQDTIKNLDPHEPVFVDASTPVSQVIRAMNQTGRGCVLVCDEGNVVGIFTERDLLLRVIGDEKSNHVPVSTVMTEKPVTLEHTSRIAETVKKMRKGGYRHMPITEQGEIIGVVSVKHIVNYLVDHFPEVYNLPPDPNMKTSTREGA